MVHLLHQSIQSHAETRPDKGAFRCRDQSISYGQLHRRSNQLANFLLSLGLPPSSRIGIMLPKCVEVPIATFGTLAAGMAYVPIDPTSKIERIAFILKDCGIEVLITDESKANLLSEIANLQTPLKHVIGVSTSPSKSLPSTTWQEIHSQTEGSPDVTIVEDDLAYIMYTSGSTGTPKGLMHTHASGLAYARHSADLYSVTCDDVLGNHAPLHFDISTFEFLTGPLVGATMILIPEEAMLFPVSLSELVESEGITFWYSVPLALFQLLKRGSMEDFNLSSLRWVLFGGEPFQPTYLAELVKRLPNAQFCNVYGPAEVNQCSYYHVPKDFSPQAALVPLGYIWKGARARIVDELDQEVTPGDVGELLIQSATMMRGYWNRPDLNAIAFHYDEVAPGFRNCYYRTGDLVRINSDGLYEFVGRKDRQVKIRGYRLELDEVEAAFSSQNAINEAAAFLRVKEDGDKELVVAVTLNPKEAYDEQAVLAFARSRLPHYGVPRQLQVHSGFPRTTSGKIDRKQLAKDYESALF